MRVVLGVQKEPRTTQSCVLLTLLIKKGRELLCIKHNGILTTNRHGHKKADKRQTNISKQIQVQVQVQDIILLQECVINDCRLFSVLDQLSIRATAIYLSTEYNCFGLSFAFLFTVNGCVYADYIIK